MDAQTKSGSKGHDPGTPVIIKTGSDDPPGSNEIHIYIKPDNLYFTEFVWEPDRELWVSQSVSTGRIQELSVVKNPGAKSDDTKQLFPEQLAEIRMKFGPDHTLVLKESNNTDQGVNLVIESMVPFDVKPPGEWNSATAFFPPISHVVFQVALFGGNKVLSQSTFEGETPTLRIDFFKPVDG